MPSTLAGSILALASAVAYSAMYFLVRAGVRKTDLDGGAFVTTVVNSLLLGGGTLVAAWLGSPPDWHATALLWFIVAGVLGTFGGRVLMLAGLRRIGPVRTASIVNSAPVVTITFSVVVLGERLSGGASLAVVLVLAGLGLLALDAFGGSDPVLARRAIAGPPDLAAHPIAAPARRASPAVTGLALSVLSAVAFGTARVARRLGLIYMADPLAGAMVAAVAALASQLAMQAAQGRISSVVVDAFRDVRPMLWLGGVASSIGLLTFFWAIRLAPLSHVAVIAASETVITMLFSWLLFRRREPLPARVVVAACCVFGAGVLVALS